MNFYHITNIKMAEKTKMGKWGIIAGVGAVLAVVLIVVLGTNSSLFQGSSRLELLKDVPLERDPDSKLIPSLPDLHVADFNFTACDESFLNPERWTDGTMLSRVATDGSNFDIKLINSDVLTVYCYSITMGNKSEADYVPVPTAPLAIHSRASYDKTILFDARRDFVTGIIDVFGNNWDSIPAGSKVTIEDYFTVHRGELPTTADNFRFDLEIETLASEISKENNKYFQTIELPIEIPIIETVAPKPYATL